MLFCLCPISMLGKLHGLSVRHTGVLESVSDDASKSKLPWKQQDLFSGVGLKCVDVETLMSLFSRRSAEDSVRGDAGRTRMVPGAAGNSPDSSLCQRHGHQQGTDGNQRPCCSDDILGHHTPTPLHVPNPSNPPLFLLCFIFSIHCESIRIPFGSFSLS